MKLDRLRSFGKTLRTRASEHRLAWLYLGFSAAVFIVALVTTFPHETLVREGLRHATAGSPTQIDFASLRYQPLLGYEVADLRIVPDTAQSFQLQVDALHAKPAILSLLIPGQRNAVELDLAIFGGQMEATVAGNPDDFAVVVVGQNLKLDEATRGAFPPPGRVSGTAALDLAAQSSDGGRTLEGTLALRAQDIALRDMMAQGFKIPDLSFEALELEAAADGDTIHVRKLVATGNEVSIRATGKIKLHRSWKRSSLDLRFELNISPDAPAGLRMIPRLLPKRKDGESFYDVRGTLARPRLQ